MTETKTSKIPVVQIYSQSGDPEHTQARHSKDLPYAILLDFGTLVYGTTTTYRYHALFVDSVILPEMFRYANLYTGEFDPDGIEELDIKKVIALRTQADRHRK